MRQPERTGAILLTGGTGQLGRELLQLGDYIAPSRSELDITDPDMVNSYVWGSGASLIVHAAAYTNTRAPDNNPAAAWECFRTNVLGTRNLVSAARCPIILISTECVLEPWNFYISTKLQAEREVQRHRHGYMVLRTSFRSDPFEYPRAFTDMWTIGDSDHVIAKLIHSAVHQDAITDAVRWVGTGAKTMYQLAMTTRPEVKPMVRHDISSAIPSFEYLCHLDRESTCGF